MGADTSPLGQLPSTERYSSAREPIQLDRGWTHLGLQTRPLATGTIQVTGGAAGTDTFDPQVNSVSLVSAPVAWTTSHNATATAIATAINANAANHNYLATVATDTVTVMQRTSGAITGALATVVTNSATTTDTDFSGDTDTKTEFVGGATFDGDKYYQLFWSGALVEDGGTQGGTAEADLTNARLRGIDFYCDGQAFQLWSGGLRTASNAIVQGISIATATWLHATLGSLLPWLDAGSVLIIKVASDEELLVKAHYF